MDQPWVAILGAVFGAVVALFFGWKRKKAATPPPTAPLEAAKTVAAEVHAEAVTQINEAHKVEVAEVAQAVASKKPAKALAALFNRLRK